MDIFEPQLLPRCREYVRQLVYIDRFTGKVLQSISFYFICGIYLSKAKWYKCTPRDECERSLIVK